MNNLIIKDEREESSRYVALIGGLHVGKASAILVLDTILIPHVEVEPGKHDLGIGSILVRRVFDDARAEGRWVLTMCPYARRWSDLHPDYRDVVRAPRARERNFLNGLVVADRVRRQMPVRD